MSLVALVAIRQMHNFMQQQEEDRRRMTESLSTKPKSSGWGYRDSDHPPVGGGGEIGLPFAVELAKESIMASLGSFEERRASYRKLLEDQQASKKSYSMKTGFLKLAAAAAACVFLTAAHAGQPSAAISDNCMVVYDDGVGTEYTFLTGAVEALRIKLNPKGFYDVRMIFPDHLSLTSTTVGMWEPDMRTFHKRFMACSGMQLPKGLK